jgi:hypothetical protein
MKKILSTTAATVITLLCQAAPQIVFQADFTKSLNANTTTKRVYPYPVKTGKNAALEQDKEKGLIIGEEKASAYYGIKGLMNSKSGSIELIVRNLNWDVKDTKKHLFIQASLPGLLYFYKHSNDGVAVYFSRDDNKQKVFLGCMPSWKRDTEHHVVFTWDNGEVSLYIDGTKARSKKFEMPQEMPARLYIGTPGKHQLNSDNTAIKMIKIYDSALSAKEVFAACKDSQPQDEDIIEE